MRSTISKSSLFLALLGLMLGCSTGRKALKRGDYDKAVYQAVNRLRSDDDNKKATVTLRRAYKFALNTRLKNIKAAQASTNPLRWEEVAQNYAAINALHNEIQRCPACLAIVPEPKSFNQELHAAREQAAEERYQLALEALKEKHNRASALEAHQHLLRAGELVPGYKDVEKLGQEALYHATLHVVVEPVPSPTALLDLNHQFFSNKIMEHLNSRQINPYVRFYTPAEVEARQLGWVDHRISMRFDQFSLGNVFSHTETEEVSRDSVLLNPDAEEPTYGRVTAKFITHEKGIVGSGILDFKITDPLLNKVVSQEKFPSEFRWVTSWATYNGDKRALNDEQKEMLDKTELSIPNPQFMFEQFAAPLHDQVVGKITNFYRNY